MRWIPGRVSTNIEDRRGFGGRFGGGRGLGLGGMPLPRCEPAASRLALVTGGAVAALLGALIGGTRLLG